MTLLLAAGSDVDCSNFGRIRREYEFVVTFFEVPGFDQVEGHVVPRGGVGAVSVAYGDVMAGVGGGC